MDHLEALVGARDELDAWGDFEQSETWVEHFPEAIEGDKNPSVPPHPLWLAIVQLQEFYPRHRLPKLTGALDAWCKLLRYSRQHGSEEPEVQRDLAVQNAKFLREWICSEIERLRGEGSPRHCSKSVAVRRDAVSASSTNPRRKRSTERGEGKAKLVAALAQHHKYADGSCLNLEPVGNNELARLAKVSESTASEFFQKQFGGHSKYRAKCQDGRALTTSIKAMQGDFTPNELSEIALEAFEAGKRSMDEE